MTSFSVLTLGCKVNSYESEAVINDLINKGYILKSFDELCDVYIINTCTVTSTSDQKSRQMISRARHHNPDAIVVAMGCYTQLNGKKALENADIVIGSNNKLAVYELINSYLKTKEEILAITNVLDNPTYEELKVRRLETHTRGFVKIQDGCENYCSYCAIPYSRGKIRSRDPLNVIDEINELVKSGVKEVILSGINTGTYGTDLKDINLAKLIDRIMNETSIYRIRLSSIEMMEVTDELLDTIEKYKDRIAMHLHVPLQGGSDTVLKRMKRKYDTAKYYEKIELIRSKFNDIALTTDVLAGFVGETEDEFNELYNFLQKVSFYELHVFPYSRRAGTVADEMEGHVDPKIKKERAHKLLELASKMKDDYENKFIGSIQNIIVEDNKNGYYHGHSSNYLDIYFKSDVDLNNQIVDVKILRKSNGKLYGEVVKVYE